MNPFYPFYPIVNIDHADHDWVLSIRGDPDVVEEMVEEMQSTQGSRWELDKLDGYAYCIIHDGCPFEDITQEIEVDGFDWEER